MKHEILNFKYDENKSVSSIISTPNFFERLFLRKRSAIIQYKGKNKTWVCTDANNVTIPSAQVIKLLSDKYFFEKMLTVAKKILPGIILGFLDAFNDSNEEKESE